MQKISSRFIRSSAAIAAIASLTAPLSAQHCSDADFKGRYAIQTHNYALGGAEDNWIAGTLVADGKGEITEWMDTAVFSRFLPDGTEEKIIRERDQVGAAIGPVLYEVSPDCQITIQLTSSRRPPDDRAPHRRHYAHPSRWPHAASR